MQLKTQRAWEGLPSTVNRNKELLESLGRTDLKSFVREVLEINRKAVEKSEQQPSSLYDRPEDIEDEEARQNRLQSPDFLAYVHVLNSQEEFDVLAGVIKEPSVG